MNKVEKILAIYKEIANDELTSGCKISIDREIATIIDWDRNWKWITILWEDWWVTRDDYKNEFTIIWHPVMIGDVIQYLQDKYQWRPDGRWGIEFKSDLYSEEAFYDDVNSLCIFWNKKREELDMQSSKCINFVYYLMQGK